MKHQLILALSILFIPIFSSFGMIDSARIQPPIAAAQSEFLFPEFTLDTLPNGIKVYLVEDRTQPLLSVNVVFRKGAAQERISGVAGFTAALLTKGTPSRPARQTAEEIDFLGGTLGGSAGWDSTSISMTILAKFARVGMALLADVALHPIFPDEEIERQRQQFLAYIRQNLNDPGYLASVALSHGLFAGHTYQRQSFGTLESISSLRRQDCIDFYKETFSPSNCFIVVSGNLGSQELRDMLLPTFGLWNTPVIASPVIPMPDPIKGRKLFFADKLGAVQTVLAVGFPTANRNDADYSALKFLNTLFGSMFGSRLNAKLREEKGYTYGAGSYLDLRQFASSFVISTSVGKSVTVEAIEDILSELHRLGSEPISEDELQLTKKYLLGSFPLQVETTRQAAAFLTSLELYDLPHDYYTKFFKEVAELTVDRLFEVQKRRFATSDIVIAGSGNLKYLRKILKKFGEIEEVK